MFIVLVYSEREMYCPIENVRRRTGERSPRGGLCVARALGRPPRISRARLLAKRRGAAPWRGGEDKGSGLSRGRPAFLLHRRSRGGGRRWSARAHEMKVEAEELSAYELQRKDNIARNEAALKALGLLDGERLKEGWRVGSGGGIN